MINSAEHKFNKIIIKMFSRAIKLFLLNPLKFFTFIKILKHQKDALKKRELILKGGESAPAILIFSITNQCNLACAGCYNAHPKRNHKDGLSLERISRLFNEASNQGIGIIILAGGEPFLRMDILRIIPHHPEVIFPVFTNGTLLENNIIFLKENPHLFPVLSIEGDKAMTDDRRGEGLYENTIRIASLLKEKSIVFGFSITLTSKNLDEILKDDFIRFIIKQGVKIVFFVEYVPRGVEDMELCLTEYQKERLLIIQNEFKRRFGALFITLPGDEESFGGCLAAGRGFIHVSAGGDVEPCPFAPYSTKNIKDISLREAISSGFIKKIRNSHHLLTEAKGGCVLWENREWVEEQRNNSLNILMEDAV